jgi:hypothetical protein
MDRLLEPEELRRSHPLPLKIRNTKPPLRTTFQSPLLHKITLGEFPELHCPCRRKPRREKPTGAA